MKKGTCPATGSTREIRAWSDRICNSATDKPAIYYSYQIIRESNASASQKNMQDLLVEFNTLQKSFSQSLVSLQILEYSGSFGQWFATIRLSVSTPPLAFSQANYNISEAQ